MRTRTLIAVLVVIVGIPDAAFAEKMRQPIAIGIASTPPGPLQAAALRAVTRLAGEIDNARSQQVPRQRDTWIGRHPVLFGALVGLGLGIGISAATLDESGNPDVTKGDYVLVFGLLGAGTGAGIGALVSFLTR